jgi:hypothetical protein
VSNSNIGDSLFSGVKEFLNAVFRMPRFSPAWFAFWFMLLLFIRDLGQNWYQMLIPGIVVYGMGAALLGVLHRLIALVYEAPKEVIIEVDEERKLKELISINSNNEVTIPVWGRIGLYAAHFLWFAAFVSYLIHRGIISI